MKVSKKQKILGGVVALGMVALTVDHITRGPSQAAAETTSQYALEQPENKPMATAAFTKSTGPSIAQRLRNSGRGYGDREMNDAFAMGDSWQSGRGASAESVAPAGMTEQQFRQMHHLSGTLTSGESGLAMVDGRIIAVGRQLDGLRLVSISHRSATFESGDLKIVLYLNERSGILQAGE